MEDEAQPINEIEQQMRVLVQEMAGQRLPAERELASQFHISRPRLRRILASLRTEGLITQSPGSGTYALALKGDFRRIALIIDTQLKLGDDPFFSQVVDCLQNAVQAMGARCVFERAERGAAKLPRLEDGALTLGLAGLEVIQQLRPTDPPVVGLLLPGNSQPVRRGSIFALDDRAAGYAAAVFLLEKGVRHICFAGRHDIPASSDRFAGVAAAAQKADVTSEFLDCHLNYAAGLALGTRLKLMYPSSGLIAANDWLALGLRTGLMSQSNTSEHQTPIVSFDGLSLVNDPALGIRSLAIPVQTIAMDAVAELSRLARSPITAGRLVHYSLEWNPEEDIT